MFDLGLAAALLLAVAPARLVGAWAGRSLSLDRGTVSDVAWWGGSAFVVTGRLAWLALHPRTLAYPIDVIRLTQGMVTSIGVVGAAAALLLLVRRRGASLDDVGIVAAIMAATAFLGWQAACGFQDRCGGVTITGWPVHRVPVALILGIVALGVVAWLAFVLRTGPGRALRRHSLIAVGVLLVAQFVVSRWQLRLAVWPTTNDLALAVLGLAAVVLAGAIRRR